MPELDTAQLEHLRELHPADLADQLQRLSTEEAEEVLATLPQSLVARTLAELEDDTAEEILAKLPSAAIARVFEQIQPEEAADLLERIDPSRRREILRQVSPEKAQVIRELHGYPEDTAGGIMHKRFVTLRSGETVAQSLERLRAIPPQRPDDITYLYVVDDQGRLLGVVPLRDLVFSPPHRPIDEIMRREIAFVRVHDDQEEVARKFEHYGFMGLPVLDDQGRLLGVVKASDALEVAQREATEDMQLMVGLSGEERALTPWTVSVRRRLPWLYVNLATAFLAAFVVGLFEDTIARWTALAVFLPIVAGQGGNAGMQTLTVIIRDMALGELTPADGWRALLKEVLLGLIHGVAVGVVVGLIGYMWKGSFELGVVAGVAMLLNLLAAAASGVLIPFGLRWLRIDPAMASSIILTTITDVAGFFFFLGLGALAMKWVGH